MAFTAEEQAVLAQLAYYDIQTNPNCPKTLAEILEECGKSLSAKLGSDYDSIIDGLMAKVKDENYTVVISVDDDHDSGFVAFAIAHPNNDVTIVCRGSEDLSKVFENKDSQKDLDTDLQIGYKKETDQQQKLEDLIDYLEKRGYNGYYFTGHSLGGNLAIHGAVYLGDRSRIRGVTTFNAPGFNDRYWDIYAMRIQRIEGKVINYENEYDIVSSILHKPGETVYVETSADGGIHHSIFELKITKGGFKKTDHTGRRKHLVNFITNGTVNNGWQLAVVLQYLRYKFGDDSITGYRDFSKSAMEIMINAAKETEDEEWWQITRWDCWYRLDKLFGSPVMDYQRLAGDVDTYYRKIIDMNGATVKDIKQIFEKVYGLDDSYAERIKQKTEELKKKVLEPLKQISDSINPGVS